MKTIKVYDLNKSELEIPEYIKPVLFKLFRIHLRKFLNDGEIYLEYSENENKSKLGIFFKINENLFERYVTCSSKNFPNKLNYLFDCLFESICYSTYDDCIINKLK